MLESSPKVSVIIPNYNYGAYLEKRIQSVLNQSFQDFELILLDDASTDNSVEILSRYKDDLHVTHFIVNDVNTGSPFKQWMKGISLAKGEWVWIAESDDWAEPTFLEKCLAYIKNYQNISVCFAGSCYVNREGAIIQQEADYWSKIKKQSRRVDYCFDGEEYIEHKLYWNNCIMNASGVLFRREYALKLQNSPFLTMRYSGDWRFWTELAMLGNILEVREVLNHFRLHESVSSEGVRTGKRLLEDMDILLFIEKQFPKMSSYKKRLRYGMLYRKIKKLGDPESRMKLFECLLEKLGGRKKDMYLLRINQYLSPVFPFLITRKRDYNSVSSQ